MAIPERRQPENVDLRESIAELEAVGSDYAELILMDTTVHIGMHNIVAAFTLPPAADVAFKQWGARAPQLIESLNLDLAYDRAVQQFRIIRGGTVFDNGFGLMFSAPHPIRGEAGQWHDIDLFTQDARGKLRMQRIGPSPTEHVQGFFNQCGVAIPMAPFHAPYELIAATIDAAEQRVLSASKSTALSGAQELIVSEQIIESNEDTVSGDADDNLARTHEISLQIVDYSNVCVKALEAVLMSDTIGERPGFKGLYINDGPRVLTTPRSLLDPAQPAAARQVQSELIFPDLHHIRNIIGALHATGI